MDFDYFKPKSIAVSMNSYPLQLEQRPWGFFFTHEIDSTNLKLKHIIVEPKSKLSYQYHRFRNEVWVVVQGILTFRNENNQLSKHYVGDIIVIGAGAAHRIINDEDTMLIIAEIQLGDCDEADIVRLEDDYNRT